MSLNFIIFFNYKKSKHNTTTHKLYILIRFAFKCGFSYRLLYNLQQQTFKYFVKALPLSQPALVRMMSDLGILGKENHLYARVFPALDSSAAAAKWRPHCYDASNDAFIVLDDLAVGVSPASHLVLPRRSAYRHMPTRQPFDVAHVRCVLHSLAQMHAASLATAGPDEADGPPLVDSFVRPDCQWFVDGLNVSVLFIKKISIEYRIMPLL